jgi:phenylacetate-CoA ligase
MSVADILGHLRSKGFWCLDSLKGGAVKKAYQDLKTYDAMDSSCMQLIEYQRSALQRLLYHATTTTKFYGNIGGQNLKVFPIIDRNIIKRQQSQFMSSRYRITDLVTMSTSGSTGTPFVCYQNREKKKRVNAEVIFYSEKAGYMVGTNLIFLRALNEQNRKSKLLQWVQNETLLDISNLNDERIGKLLSEIETTSQYGSMMLAYASTYDALRDYFERKGYNVVGTSKMSGMVSSSEMLFDETRDAMVKAFRCRCFSRYSNQENGIIGQDDGDNNTFLLNEAHYIVEIMRMDVDKPTKDGEVGRIVITDLYNLLMARLKWT